MDDLLREVRWSWGLVDLWWRGFWFYNREALDLIFNQIVVLLIVYLFALMGLAITRRTEMGRWLGNTGIVLALVFVATILSIWISFFDGDPWRYTVRLVIAFVLVKAIIAMKTAFGGWGPLHQRAWHNLQGMMRRRGYHAIDDTETVMELEREG